LPSYFGFLFVGVWRKGVRARCDEGYIDVTSEIVFVASDAAE
jgi:hypothetical protein